MTKEDLFRGVLCPTCGKEMYRNAVYSVHRNVDSSFYDWRCTDCVYCYTEVWLRSSILCDFPDLICNYEEGRDKLCNIIAFREANLESFLKSGLLFKDWFKKNKFAFKNFKAPSV